jgi:hypothetical protein
MNLLKQGRSVKTKAWGIATICAAIALLFVQLLAAESLSRSSDNTSPERLTVTEYEVKAAYVYYFAKFAVWPQEVFATPGSPIVIGVLGDDKFGSILERIVNAKVVQDRPIAVRLLKWPGDLQGCQIIYVSLSEQKQFNQIAESLNNRSVLTVTEADEGVKSKGIVNLFVEDGKVRFEVDIADAEKAHLQISSKLLRMAWGFEGKNLAKKD